MKTTSDARQIAYQHEIEITRELTRQLRGKWPQVLASLLPELIPAIEAGPKKHVTCPYHGGVNDFRVYKDFDETGSCVCTCNPKMTNGFDVIMHARRVDFMEAKRMVLQYLGGDLSASLVPARYVAEQDPDEIARNDARLKRRIKTIWEESFPLDHPSAQPVRNWLTERGIPEAYFPRVSVRCHPKLGYWEGNNCIGSYPAMIAMARGADGRCSTIHRTWLTADGRAKAPVPSERKLYEAPSSNPVVGACVPLSEHEHPVLNVGEGLETSLSAMAIAEDWPTVSTLNKQLLIKLDIPSYVKLLIVWADRDRSNAGQAAAIELVDRARAHGMRCVAFLPPFAIPAGEKSIDWNDVLLRQGIEVIRSNIKVLQFKRRVAQILQELGCAAEGSMQRRASR